MVTLKTNDDEDLKDNVIQEIVEEDRTIPPPEKRFSALEKAKLLPVNGQTLYR